MFSKKWVSAFVILALYIFSPVNSFCQGGYSAVSFLKLQQSPFLMGAGQIGTSIPTNDAIGFYLNPAQLGYSARDNNLSTFFMPQKTEWIPYFRSHLRFQSSGISAGYNFNKRYKVPLSIGVGYIHNRFLYGEYYSPISKSEKEIYDKFDCFSVGIGYEYYLLFNFGFSVKPFKSVFGYSTIGNLPRDLEASGTAYDFGAMLITPISKLFFDQYKYNLNEKAILKPNAAITLGYSLSNVGKEIYYVTPAQKDPIPRTARLGYSINLGLDLFVSEIKLNTVDYSFTAEAEDILINRDSLGYNYQSVLSQVQPIKHLLKLNGDDKIVIHKGHILRLLETVILTSGRYHGAGYNFFKTSGIGISSQGIFKLLAMSADNNVFSFVANHFSIEYYTTTLFEDHEFETKLNGLALYFRGFEI